MYDSSKLVELSRFADHVAATATGASRAESLHRIEPAVVREALAGRKGAGVTQRC